MVRTVRGLPGAAGRGAQRRRRRRRRTEEEKGGGREVEVEVEGLVESGAAKRVLVWVPGTSRLPFDLAAEKEHCSTRTGGGRRHRPLRGGGGEDGSEDAEGGRRRSGERRRRRKKRRRRRQSAKKNAERPNKPRKPRVTWAVADMLSLPFPDHSFDAVIDKGVLDALFRRLSGAAEQRKWRPRDRAGAVVPGQRALSESHRVLRPEGGCYVQVSFEQPHFRRPFLDAPGLELARERRRLSGKRAGLQFFFYLRRRGGGIVDSSNSECCRDSIPRENYKPQESPMHDHMDDGGFPDADVAVKNRKRRKKKRSFFYYFLFPFVRSETKRKNTERMNHHAPPARLQDRARPQLCSALGACSSSLALTADAHSSDDRALLLPRPAELGVERLRRPEIIVGGVVGFDCVFVGQKQLLLGLGSFVCTVH